MNRISFGKTPKPALIVGSLAYDHVQTPSADSGRVAGGSANYAALAAAHFAPARLVGVVGRDYEPELLDALGRRGVDLRGVSRDEARDTFFWRGRYGENFDVRETLETRLNAFEGFDPEIPPEYQESEYVLLGAIQPALQARVLDSVKGAPFAVADTIRLYVERDAQALRAVLARVSLVCINDEEASLLTGCADVGRAGEALCRDTGAAVIIKQGGRGASLFHPEGRFDTPAFRVPKVADPTGAGDSFAGALVGALSAQGGISFAALKRAMCYASASASLTVEAFSFSRLAAPDAAERIRERAAALESQVLF